MSNSLHRITICEVGEQANFFLWIFGSRIDHHECVMAI